MYPDTRTYSMVVPSLTVSAARVKSGRLSWRGRVIGRSWVGFREFVVLVANTPDAAAQLTPAARSEVCRLLQIDC